MDHLFRLCSSIFRSLQTLTDSTNNPIIVTAHDQVQGMDLRYSAQSLQGGISGTGLLMMTLIVLFILMVMSIRSENAKGRAAELMAERVRTEQVVHDQSINHSINQQHIQANDQHHNQSSNQSIQQRR